MTGVLASACLVAAALAVAWPARSRRARRRRLGLTGDLSARWRGLVLRPPDARGLIARLDGRAGWSVTAWLAATLGFVAAGPVAASVAAVYGAVAAGALGRRERRRAARRERRQTVDALGALAADLRAGLPANPAIQSLVDIPRVAQDPLAARAFAAVSLAESTGAPLAELLDRIEGDARASDRAAATADAQSAGARATALLLAGLPVAGIALGHAIGADPLRVLLHTPLGAGCAFAALALQLAGLAWSARLARSAVNW